MNEGKRPTGVDSPMETSDVMSLVELQKFLADELAATGMGSHLEKAFTPITDGLGLESPTQKARKPAYVPEVPPVAAATPSEKPAEKKNEGGALRQALGDAPSPSANDKRLFEQMRKLREKDNEFSLKSTSPGGKKSFPKLDPEELPPVDSLLTKKPSHTPLSEPEAPKPAMDFALPPPPPMPRPSGFRRLQAVILDEVFVLSLFAFALLITANLFSKGSAGSWMTRLGNEFNNPMFLRFALLEYTTIWLAYLAIGIGLLDMTFGMWVWGLRISYGHEDERIGLRKWIRILLSFLFLAAIAPLVLLAIRVGGRNIIDRLSGSHLYLSSND